jgi:hypothetical protein
MLEESPPSPSALQPQGQRDPDDTKARHPIIDLKTIMCARSIAW